MRNAETTLAIIRERVYHSRRSGHRRAVCFESCKHGSAGAVTRSCGRNCYDWSYAQDITQCATIGTLPRRAAGAIRRCEALGTTYPHPNRVAGLPVRELRRLPASRRSGTRVGGRANSGELPINVVRTSKPKMLTGLNQDGTWPGAGASPFPCRRCRATGEQAEPKPSGIRPRNVVSPSSSLRGRPAARRSPMGRRVEDEGESECRPVIGRIGIESSDKITLRESGLTSLRSFVTRKPGQPLQGAMQMMADVRSLCWCGLPPRCVGTRLVS